MLEYIKKSPCEIYISCPKCGQCRTYIFDKPVSDSDISQTVEAVERIHTKECISKS